MNQPQFLDSSIAVEAKISEGQLRPQTVTWEQQTLGVISIGRQWTDQDGTHVLVELNDQSRMEITLGQDLGWRLQRYWPPSQMAV